MFEEVRTFRWFLRILFKAVWLVAGPVILGLFLTMSWIVFWDPPNVWDGSRFSAICMWLTFAIHCVGWVIQMYTFVILGEFR